VWFTCFRVNQHSRTFDQRHYHLARPRHYACQAQVPQRGSSPQYCSREIMTGRCNPSHNEVLGMYSMCRRVSTCSAVVDGSCTGSRPWTNFAPCVCSKFQGCSQIVARQCAEEELEAGNGGGKKKVTGDTCGSKWLRTDAPVLPMSMQMACMSVATRTRVDRMLVPSVPSALSTVTQHGRRRQHGHDANSECLCSSVLLFVLWRFL
jgi:hypothetical protein